jgi:hypothetical protein
MHQIHYHWLVSLQVILPWIFTCLFIINALWVNLCNEGFLLNSVQILMKAIQHIVEELTWVLLILIIEL